MRVLVAPQEFKGTLTANEATSAITRALRATRDPSLEIDMLPMADGGPGTTEALIAAVGGESRTTAAHDPLMRPLIAGWGVLADGTAVIECAAASGLTLLSPAERDAGRTSSFGTGELIAAAIDAGVRDLLIGLGGSATNDGGAGMAAALGFRFVDIAGHELPPGGRALLALDRIERPSKPLPGVRVLGAADVTNPLLGPKGASAVYGPQKGATAGDVEALDAALTRLADVIERDLGVDVRDVERGGAAGGLGAGLVAFLGAELREGAAIIANATGLDRRAAAADVVITGEGRLDGQTVFGKSTARVARAAAAAGKPVICLAGSTGAGYEEAARLFTAVEVLEAGDAATALAAAALRALLGLGLSK